MAAMQETCQVCYRDFSSAEEFEKHQMKPYSCEKCDESFEILGVLKTHQASHTSGGYFSCVSCKLTFNSLRIWKDTKGLTIQEELALAAMTVINHTQQMLVWDYINGLILEKNHTCVLIVQNHLNLHKTWKDTSQFTLDWNHLNAPSVISIFHKQVSLISTTRNFTTALFATK